MLLDPRDWSLASRIDDVLPALSRRGRRPRVGRDARLGARAGQPAASRRPAAAAAELARPARRARRRPRAARAARRRRGHAPVRAVERRRGLAGRALPVDLRLDARAGAARADVRAARARRGARRRRRPCARCAGCACTCRCCSRWRPTRRSGRAATPGWPSARVPGLRHVPARRHPARVRRATPSTSRRSTCCCAATRSPSRRSCGGTCGCSRKLGTLEVRIMDAQTRVGRQRRAGRARAVRWCGWRRPRATSPTAIAAHPEVLDENRFLATRDGMRAEFIDPEADGAPARRATSSTSCSPPARRTPPSSAARPSWRRSPRSPTSRATTASGCSPASRQGDPVGPGLGMLVCALADDFTAGLPQPAALA